MPHVYGDKEQFQWPSNCDIGDMKPKTSYSNREVYYDGAKVKSDPKSPFFVVGNSFIRTPMDSPCSLPTLLSLKSNYSIDYLLVYGEGPFLQFPRNLVTNPERYLKDKKVCIFQVGLTHLFDMTHQIANIKQIDDGLVLLNGKRLIKTYIPQNDKIEKPSVKEETLKNLKNPVYFSVISSENETEIAHISSMDYSVDTTKQVICLIPAIAFKSSYPITLKINGITQKIPGYYSQLDYVPLSFTLPAGTEDITVSASTESGTASYFALSNIQIYQ